MARTNTKTATTRKGSGPVTTKVSKKTGKAKTVLNGEGFLGFKRDPKSELFLAAVTSLNENTFYESAKDRQDRIAGLSRKVAKDGEWIVGFVGWLRNEANMRSIASVVAVEAVHARLSAKMYGHNRQIIAAAIGRLDEAGDILAYWTSRYGKNIPSAVKRGVNDALETKMTENSVLKWSGRMKNGAVSLRDVLNLTHHSAGPLGKYVIDSEYSNEVDTADLPVIEARRAFNALSRDEAIKALTGPDGAKIIKDARLTHEAIAGAIGTIPAEVWEVLVPTMGYMALRMNLRRIHESGISRDLIDTISKRIADTESAKAAHAMPLDFMSAYRNAPLDFHPALQSAGNGVLANIPALSGRTLILVDHSGSMSYGYSSRGSLTPSDAANMFGAALHFRAENSDLYSFDTTVEKITRRRVDLLPFVNNMPRPCGGTYTRHALETTYDGHDRVILLTDEQAHYSGDVFKGIVPENVPCFTWNLSGYASACSIDGPGRVTFGGLTDKGFGMIPMLESGVDQGWPWE